MATPANLRATGDRIERLLDDLQSADPRVSALAEELVRAVTDLYGGGLARVVEIVGEHAGDRAPDVLDGLADDELVASLLLVHGLHPESLTARVEAALAGVRPLLAQHDGDVELLDLDAGAGAVLLRLLGSCDGCPSSAVTLQHAVERAIVEAAPEIVTIDLAPAAVPPAAAGVAGVGAEVAGGRGTSVPVVLRRKPTYDACPSEVSEVLA
ncbi:MAG TPA: NifU family protein [Acidimicrobiales bacterium]|nr:NifU family protein [Acidimicrobiales bacterium]